MSSIPQHLIDRQDAILQENSDKIDAAYTAAKNNDIEPPAVLVLDLTDKIARQIGKALGKEPECERLLQKAKKNRSDCTVVWFTTAAKAAAALPPEHQEYRDALLTCA